MKLLLIATLSILIYTSSHAQQAFVAKGKIEFERITHLHKTLGNEEWDQMMKKSTPPIKTDYFNLFFNDTKTLYKPGREVVTTQKVPDWMLGPASENVVFTNLVEKQFSSQKAVFEATYIINDNLPKYNWKITGETRTIAGFECRKATTIIMDSVFVVAFSTDQIVPAGGPESFNGLPGMILGLAIPRLHTTWYATKLEMVDVKDTELVSPKKGKKATMSELSTQLQNAMKDWVGQ